MTSAAQEELQNGKKNFLSHHVSAVDEGRRCTV
jgi:hypothetical protein